MNIFIIFSISELHSWFSSVSHHAQFQEIIERQKFLSTFSNSNKISCINNTQLNYYLNSRSLNLKWRSKRTFWAHFKLKRKSVQGLGTDREKILQNLRLKLAIDHPYLKSTPVMNSSRGDNCVCINRQLGELWAPERTS